MEGVLVVGCPGNESEDCLGEVLFDFVEHAGVEQDV